MSLYIYAKELNEKIAIDLETLLVLNVYKLLDLNITLKIVKKDVTSPLIFINLKQFEQKFVFLDDNEVLDIVKSLKWPALHMKHNLVVGGLCSVARQLIKLSESDKFNHLLGFRESCLAACSESSVWTKFCEIDIVSTIKALLNCKLINEKLPDDLLRFEYHLRQPVKIHNVYKVARERNNDKTIESCVPVETLNVPHCFSEGPYLTLADIILLPCYDIVHKIYPESQIKLHFPLTNIWFEGITKNQNQNRYLIDYSLMRKPLIENNINFIVNYEIKQQSLYVSDPNRYRPQSRPYTKQNDVESALNIVRENLKLSQSQKETFGKEVQFIWDDLPLIARPSGGALPEKRSKRKEEQLENLAKAVLKITLNFRKESQKTKIVDFCSGSGHLGILLATLLPDCHIVLVENKEKSLSRALQRIDELSLSNITILQSNLDYFQGTFDIGVALHACGLATDLLIQNCIENKAHFVCCPCCYGGIHDSYHISFPRSDEFLDVLTDHQFLCIAHAADQTHDHDNVKTRQGYDCMDIVDSDRKFHAESRNYDVTLSKLYPENCTPKNNLLVGLYKGI